MDKLMSQREVKKAQVLELLKDKKISQEEAAKRLDITTRQVRRLSKRYRLAGMDGLISKKRGSASNRRLDDTIRTTAINLIVVRTTVTLARRWPVRNWLSCMTCKCLLKPLAS